MKAEELFDLGLRHYTKKEYPRALALFEEAAAHPGEEVRSRKMPWHVCP